MGAVEERLHAVFDLRELAIAMRRQALRREHPSEDADQIEARLRDWVVRPKPPRHRPPGEPQR